MKKSVVKSKQYRQSKTFSKRKRTRKFLVALLVIIALSSWSFAFSKLTKIQALAIQSVEVFGVDSEVSSDIRAEVETALDEDLFGIFSRRSAITYPDREIKKRAQSVSERIEDVIVKRKGLHSLIVTVKEKSPAAIVCANLPDFGHVEESDCLLSDNKGYIYKEAEAVSSTSLAKYYIPKATIGQFATSTLLFSKLQSLYLQAVNNNIDVRAILIKDDGEYEMYATNPVIGEEDKSADSVSVIYFSEVRSFEDQLANLISFWNDMVKNAKANKESLKFDYIDVRYGQNVFYRLAYPE